jgi:hypothetical protein
MHLQPVSHNASCPRATGYAKLALTVPAVLRAAAEEIILSLIRELTSMQPQVVSEETDPVPRAGDIERAAVEWLRAELNDPAIVSSDNFLDIGGHSLTFSKLNVFLTDTFRVALDMKTTYEHSISRAVAETCRATPRAGQRS